MKLRTVDAALGVLEMLASAGTITVRDVADQQGRSRSSAYRLVRTLHERGWLTQSGRDGYAVGPLAMMLGLNATRAHPVRDAARPWLERIAREYEETATLSLLVSDYRVCIDQVESHRQIRMSVPIAQPFPLYAGASGRAILSALSTEELDAYLAAHRLAPLTDATITGVEELRMQLDADEQRGYAVAVRERDPEAFSVAAPIVGSDGVLGSIAICGPASRFMPTDAPRYGQAVSDAAREIGRSLD